MSYLGRGIDSKSSNDINYYFVYVFHLIKFVCLFFSFSVATGFPGE